MSEVRTNAVSAVSSNTDITIDGNGTGGVTAGKRVKNAQTGTTYTLVLADAGKVITMSNGSAQTLTIPPNSSVAFPVNCQIDIINKGAGVTSVTGGTGVTLNGVSTGTGALDGQYKAVTIIKDAADAWIMMGGHGTVE